MMIDWLPFVALAGLLIGLFAWLRQDVKELRHDLKAQGTRLDKRIDDLAARMDKRTDDQVAGLKEQAKEQASFREEMISRLSKLEGLLEGLRESITGRRAA